MSSEIPGRPSSHRGLVEVYTGDGRGKTTAALGLALRAAGQGFHVHIIFFMKGVYPYGEQKALSHVPNITFERYGLTTFAEPGNIKPQEREEARKALNAAADAIATSKYDLIVLDEIIVAAAWKLIDSEDVISLIHSKPPSLELVLTGRYADEKIAAHADLVTEMAKVKHPYDRGIPARKGIEY